MTQKDKEMIIIVFAVMLLTLFKISKMKFALKITCKHIKVVVPNIQLKIIHQDCMKIHMRMLKVQI